MLTNLTSNIEISLISSAVSIGGAVPCKNPFTYLLYSIKYLACSTFNKSECLNSRTLKQSCMHSILSLILNCKLQAAFGYKQNFCLI